MKVSLRSSYFVC